MPQTSTEKKGLFTDIGVIDSTDQITYMKLANRPEFKTTPARIIVHSTDSSSDDKDPDGIKNTIATFNDSRLDAHYAIGETGKIHLVVRSKMIV